MPFDGIVTKCVVDELSHMLTGARVEKIFQPEADEIILNLRAGYSNVKLLLSASASYPRIHLTSSLRENPSVPPVFCMLLRKHLSGGKITNIQFHDFERIITISVESMSELGDITEKRIIIEIMGRYSNIIFVTSDNKIIDAIKHVDSEVSSVREVMPARAYVLPPQQDKISPGEVTEDFLKVNMESSPETAILTIEKFLLSKIRGFSPLICREICFRAGIDGKRSLSSLNDDDLNRVSKSLVHIVDTVLNSSFKPCLIYDQNDKEKLIDFYCIELKQYGNIKHQPSISEALELYYAERDRNERLKQKKNDVSKLLSNSLDRCKKKLALQQEKLREVSDRDKLKLAGELILANIYNIPPTTTEVSLKNFYSDNYEPVTIKLDDNLTPQANAQRYFKQYNKAKSAFAYTNSQVEETMNEIEYLESVSHMLECSFTPAEIDEIRQELSEQGYMNIKSKKQKAGNNKKKLNIISVPIKFKSSDGIEILVGKNNRQNDILTLKTASSNDIWLHTKDVPGSHVIIRKQQQDIPDSTLLEAANIAACHSKARQSSNVGVDYTMVRNVKKPSGAKPGMVIYENYRTIFVTPDEKLLSKLRVN